MNAPAQPRAEDVTGARPVIGVGATAPSAKVPADATTAPGIGEVLYFRADARGEIVAANGAFRRFSGDDGAADAAIEGQGEAFVRRGLMSEALRMDAPTVLYAPFRANEGECWMLEAFLPLADGAASVAFRPPDAAAEALRPVLSEAGRMNGGAGGEATGPAAGDEEPSMKDWRAALDSCAAAQGFTSYEAFSAFAFGQALAARGRALDRGDDDGMRILVELNETFSHVMAEQAKLSRSFDALQRIPNNMRIVASRLEPAGGPVSVIAENYKASSLVIAQRLRGFVGARDSICERVSREAASALLILGAVRLMSEAANAPASSGSRLGDDESERRRIAQICAEFGEKARAGMQRAVAHSTALQRASEDVRRLMLGLDTIRVLGRVESSRMRDAGGLGATIDQLDAFHSEIRARLDAIRRLTESAGHAMTAYLRAERD